MMQDQGLIINGLWIQGKGEFHASGLGQHCQVPGIDCLYSPMYCPGQDLLEKHVFLCSLVSLFLVCLEHLNGKFQAKNLKGKGNSMHLVGDEG